MSGKNSGFGDVVLFVFVFSKQTWRFLFFFIFFYLEDSVIGRKGKSQKVANNVVS